MTIIISSLWDKSGYCNPFIKGILMMSIQAYQTDPYDKFVVPQLIKTLLR